VVKKFSYSNMNKPNELYKPSQSTDTVWHRATVTRERRAELNGHKSALLWFTGLSGSGKSTIAHSVEERLFSARCRATVLDGDNVRHGLCGDLGFSIEDRSENIRRIGEVTKLFINSGVIIMTAFISPIKKDRQLVKELLGGEDFIQIFCDCPLEVCEQRDVKGNYQKAREGKIRNYTGIDSPYELPDADLILKTAENPLEESVEQVINLLKQRKIIPAQV
jgi:adenylylsulfate kinase